MEQYRSLLMNFVVTNEVNAIIILFILSVLSAWFVQNLFSKEPLRVVCQKRSAARAEAAQDIVYVGVRNRGRLPLVIQHAVLVRKHAVEAQGSINHKNLVSLTVTLEPEGNASEEFIPLHSWEKDFAESGLELVIKHSLSPKKLCFDVK